jgi:two-component system response regulator YesN
MVDIQEVKRLIRLHYQEIRSIDDVASFTKLSPETIRKDFIRNEHMRLSEYIARVRIEKAKRLLEQTRMTCRQICVTVGFSREEVGERVFKRIVGMTMMQHREQSHQRSRRRRQ